MWGVRIVLALAILNLIFLFSEVGINILGVMFELG
jgi:hypothetical protein